MKIKSDLITFYFKLLVVLIICVIPTLAVFSAGFIIPAQFDRTYYGELGAMYDRLYAAKRNKIVIIANSSVAFGLRSDLIESGLTGYDVINFGLYGAIGTKAMLELSKNAIREGDVIIIAPEQFEQSMSLYFSGNDTWKGIDGNFKILNDLSADSSKMMAGSYIDFAFTKYKYLVSGEKPKTDDVYSKASFERNSFDVGFMTYDRPYNTMVGGYDPNTTVSFDTSIIQDNFIDYLNDYYEYAYKKGAKVFFNFSPVNRLSLTPDVDEQKIENYYSYLADRLKFRVIGNPLDYILDHDWFYDSNFHMNSAGMFVHSRLILEDIKSALNISSPTYITIPEKPIAPPPEIIDGDNSDADKFIYSILDNSVTITGLTESGKTQATLTIPATYEEKAVTAFNPDVFAQNKVISSIIIPENVRVIYNNSFDGCTHLVSLILKHTSPSSISVGSSLLDGAPACNIYLPAASVTAFSTHYNWSKYASALKGY